MNTTELLKSLCERDAIPRARVKDLKTSLRYLEHALTSEGQNTTQNIESLANHYQKPLRAYLTSRQPEVSPHTIRNTLNNLSLLFRQAQVHGLIQTFTPRPERMTRQASSEIAHRTSPYRHRLSKILRPERFWCGPDQWPPSIRQGWDNYAEARQLEVRESTLKSYSKYVAFLVGYSIFIEKTPMTSWDEIFDLSRIKRFIQWHTKRNQAPRITLTAFKLAGTITNIAKYQNRQEFDGLHAMERKLPKPEPMHNKQHPDHNIELKELEDVGLTLLHEARTMIGARPRDHKKYPGLVRAIRHQMGLVLRLLVRIPMRQRNIREMRLGQNLFQDAQGVWQIRFHGEELKISQRGGRTNTFSLPFPPDLVEHLEEFLHHYRPLIRNADQYQQVFVGRQGMPYTQQGLAQSVSDCVFQRLGKRFYPHLIRTIWTDTCLLKTQDISTVAFMLNDRPETVLKRYHELRANDHIQKAEQFMTSVLGA